MLDSTVAITSSATNTFFVIDSLRSEEVWRRVENEINAGRVVWLSGAPVNRLAQRFGIEREGRYWIPFPAPAAQAEWVYHARDVALSALALLLLSPLLAIIILLVKRSSPGPVFYRTTGVGKGQQHFVLRKFRSMRVLDASQDQAARREQFRAFVENKATGKVLDTTRLTPIGAFLRKHSLDELPQLWNVLCGEMALVGPRPCLLYEIEFFPRVTWQRFNVRPGLTGLAQVTGRGRVTLEESLIMDMYYSRARTFSLDLQILFDTLRVVLRGEGDK